VIFTPDNPAVRQPDLFGTLLGQIMYQVSRPWKLGSLYLFCLQVDQDIHGMQECGETCQEDMKKLSAGLLGKVCIV